MAICLFTYIITAFAVAATLAAGAIYDAECGGSTNALCDTSVGLFCDKGWSKCSIGVCSCKPGHVWDTDKCKIPIAYDGNCSSTDTTCIAGLVCTNSLCKCAAGSTYKNNLLCLPDNKKLVGKNCTGDVDCFDANCDTEGDEHTNKCICPDGHNEDNGYCGLPRLGENCDPNNTASICQPPETVQCPAGQTTCACKEDRIPWSGTSLVKGCKVNGMAQDGDTCENDDSCTGSEIRCVPCGKGTVDSSKQCRKISITTTQSSAAVGKYGNECGGTTGNSCDTTDNLKCETFFTGCTIGRCMCKDGYQWDAKYCKKSKDYDGDCSNTDTICVADLVCTNNLCKCVAGSAYKKNQCLPDNKKLVGENCMVDVDCFDRNCDTTGDAATNKCICFNGEIYDDSKICRNPWYGEKCDPSIGYSCYPSITVHCSTDKKTCVCKQDKIPWSLDLSSGCKDNGDVLVNKVCVNDDECEGPLKCAACGLGLEDGTKKCRKQPAKGEIKENAADGIRGSIIAIIAIYTLLLLV